RARTGIDVYGYTASSRDVMTQSQHIIIVDDEAPAREMVGDYLKMHGFTVTLCDGGKSLRGVIETNVPDLVVLDLNMPEEGGLSRERLLELANARDAEAFDRAVDLRIMRIRCKIEIDPTKPAVIRTIRGGGYLFSPTGDKG